jgi:hypothetical protein
MFSSWFILSFLFMQLKSVDVRERGTVRNWSAPEVFGSRAQFSIDNKPESLVIKVS